jgi:hypothetical protein
MVDGWMDVVDSISGRAEREKKKSGIKRETWGTVQA